MINSKNIIEHNTYLISTNIRSFGYIISDTDKNRPIGNNTSENFFDIFCFEPEISSKIFELLNAPRPCTIYAIDKEMQGFLFYQSSCASSIFAFIKKIDINCDIAATIIRKGFSNSIICLNGNDTNCSEEDYVKTYDIIRSLGELLSVGEEKSPQIQEMLNSAADVSDGFLIDKAESQICVPNNNDGYIFSVGGFALFLSFLYMTEAKHKNAINVCIKLNEHQGHHLACAQILIIQYIHAGIKERLAFLRNTMDSQNLNMFYKEDGDEIKIVFLPYYIDDGLHGVKAPIENFKLI